MQLFKVFILVLAGALMALGAAAIFLAALFEAPKLLAFGASRCMFESNFPVDKISYSYPVFWNACNLMAKGASGSEKADLFAGSAARCYRLNGLV